MEQIPDLNRLRKCKKKAEEKLDLKELGSICNAIGELLSQNGYYEEAISEHETEQRASEALHDQIGVAVACRKIGEGYCKLGQFDKALKFQNKYLALAQECNDQVEVQRALATLGNMFFTQADDQGTNCNHHLLDQAEKKFLQALRVCTELRASTTLTESEFLAMKGRLLLNLGLVYDVRGADKESTEYLQKALTIAKQGRLEEEEFLCHFNTASQELRRGQPIAACLSLQQTLTLATRLHSKPRQSEVCCHLAIAHVCAGDVKLAKHYLKKAYRLQSAAPESAKLTKLYKTVNMVEKLWERLSGCEAQSQEMFNIHEKLGDAFTEIGIHCGSYATAIQHYQQMVECGEQLGLSADRLVPAHVSLAQTYADNRQPNLAISSYHKELHLRGDDHEQVCRTWLNIAELEEKKGDGYKVLSKSYMSAFNHAKKANHLKLQVQVLRSLIAVQVLFKEVRHKEQTEEKLKQVLTKHGLKLGDSLSEEEDSQPVDRDDLVTSDHDSDISISDLTDSDKSDEENVHPVLNQPAGTARVRRHKPFKKNEKGETPLHIACINGNLKKVKSLLTEGHPVNVRDHCGWTPLHEAANHDFADIVEVLLKAGAEINDRGGAECGGFTPLIDAAACGNLDMVQLLVDRRANVLAKDDKGCTALQALRTWFKEYADTTDDDSISHYNSVLQLLQDKMSSAVGSRVSSCSSRAESTTQRASGGRRQQGGQNSVVPSSRLHHRTPSGSKSCDTGLQRGHRAKQSLPDHSHQAHLLFGNVSSEEDNDGEERYSNPQLDDFAAPAQSATEAYRSSILALGSSTQRAAARASVSKHSTSSSSPRAPQPALISEREIVGDDWLIDDMRPPSCRKRRDHSRLGGSMLTGDSVRSDRKPKRARLSMDRHKRRMEHSDDSDDDAGYEEGKQRLPGDRIPQASPFPSSGPDCHVAVSGGSDISGEEDNGLPTLFHSSRTKTCAGGSDTSLHGSRTKICISGNDTASSSTDQFVQEVPSRLSSSQTEQSVWQGFSGAADCPSVTDTANHTNSSHTSPTVGPARVRVKIEGSVFLIPMPTVEQKTVGWLTEQASHRYNNHFGRRPFLTLSSADGAILSTDDVLSDVLTNGEQLDGAVLGWDQPALSDRYSQACKTLNTVRYRNIYGILKEADTSGKLSLSGLGLRFSVLLPITTALRGQTSLTQLHLPGNHLGDSGLKSLLSALGDLRALTHLNLCGNGITDVGLAHLAKLLTPAMNTDTANPAMPLQLLQQFDVSHNPLGSSIADSVCHVVKGLPSLKHLNLSACHLTCALFMHNRPALAECLQDSSVQQLDMSCNDLGSLGVELLLRCINIKRLTALDLGHTCSTSQPTHLAHHLKVFLTQGCALQSLSLENCCLRQDDVEVLCRFPVDVPGFEKLTLSLNKAVTMDSVQRLMDNSVLCADSQLRHLEVLSCSLPAPFPTSTDRSTPVSSFLPSLKSKLWCPHPLQYLALSCTGLDKEFRDSLCELWIQRWPQSRPELSTHTLLLTSKPS